MLCWNTSSSITVMPVGTFPRCRRTACFRAVHSRWAEQTIRRLSPKRFRVVKPRPAIFFEGRTLLTEPARSTASALHAIYWYRSGRTSIAYVPKLVGKSAIPGTDMLTYCDSWFGTLHSHHSYPRLHSPIGSERPLKLQYRPAEHSSHSERSRAPAVLLNVPKGQGSGTAVPFLQKLPDGHGSGFSTSDSFMMLWMQ